MKKLLCISVLLLLQAAVITAAEKGKTFRDVGQQMVMDGEDVFGEGGLDEIYITDDMTEVNTGLKVERSFSDELNTPLDKENMERSYTEYVKF